MKLSKVFSSRRQDERLHWFTEQGAVLLTELGIKPGDYVLDFGCGIGSYTVPLLQVTDAQGLVIAVDNDAKKLAATREQAAKWNAPGNLREIHTTGEGTLSAVADDSLDAALVFDVLQHVKDWEELFGNIVRCLHPGGRLLINPSVLSHPGKVDADNLRSVLSRHNIRITSRRACRLMHYKHFTEDEIWVCETCTSRDDDAGG